MKRRIAEFSLQRKRLEALLEEAQNAQRASTARAVEAESLALSTAQQIRSVTAERDQALMSIQELRRSLTEARELLISVRERESRAAALADLEKHIIEGAPHVESLVRQINEGNEELSKFALYVPKLERELEAVQKAALSETTVMTEYVTEVGEEIERLRVHEAHFAELENRFIAQTEELIAAVRSEGAEIALLVDTVQASHFWKFKHWLGRARARLIRR